MQNRYNNNNDTDNNTNRNNDEKAGFAVITLKFTKHQLFRISLLDYFPGSINQIMNQLEIRKTL